MTTAFDPGMNRTGASLKPSESTRTAEGAIDGGSAPGGPADVAALRADFARDAEPMGHVPPPTTLKGVVKTAMKAVKGEKATVLVDKVGERLAFERTGVRLYELLLTKAEVYSSWDGGPSREELLRIQQDELAHFGLCKQALLDLGADPTAMTPSANLAKNISMGIPAVLADPRTDLRQCLEAILVAELADNASWENLIALARDMGNDALAERFELALRTEQDHLTLVKRWVAAAVSAAADKKKMGAGHEQERPSV